MPGIPAFGAVEARDCGDGFPLDLDKMSFGGPHEDSVL
jgi:hypothetical protein